MLNLRIDSYSAGAETKDLKENAVSKLIKKKFDYIFLNDISIPGAGFGSEFNLGSLISKDGEIKEIALSSKMDIAKDIFDEILNSHK